MGRTNMADTDLMVLADFNPTVFANLKAKLNEHDAALDELGVSGDKTASVVTITSGNVTIGAKLNQLSISGTKAFTLPDGNEVGQQTKIYCSAATSTPAGTLTVTTPEAGSPSTLFYDTVGQSTTWLWTGTAWRCIGCERAGTSGANGVVIGTTVLTSKCLWRTYVLSVTGTVNSTGTSALPNGNCVGDRCTISVSTAASIPVGSLDGAYTVLGAAKTHMQNIDATTEIVNLEWDGSGWAVTSSTLTGGHPTFA